MNTPGKNRMFKFVTETWNPIGGACKTKCKYCYAAEIAKHYQMAKYEGPARIYPHELNKDFKVEDFVFVSDMRDMFERSVPSEQIQSVLDFIIGSPAKFLLLTKHPDRYAEFDLPPNCVIGATVESDCDHLVSADAPKVWDRLHSLALVEHSRKMVSIEPIMRFTPDFEKRLISMGLEFVAVGYDNHKHRLDEPTLAQTLQLIKALEAAGIKVHQKAIRERWNGASLSSKPTTQEPTK